MTLLGRSLVVFGGNAPKHPTMAGGPRPPSRAKTPGLRRKHEHVCEKERALLLNESIRRAVVVALTVLIAPPLAARRLSAQELGEEALRQIAAVVAEKRARTPAERKLDTALLYAYRRSRSEAMVAGLPPLTRVADRANVQSGMVVVDVQAEVTEDLRQAVADLGGSVVSAYPAFGSLRARVPVHRLVELAERPEIRFIGPEEGFIVNTGSQTSQGDTAHAVASTRTSLGINGTGVKVGVLSDGVNSLAARQATGDLPPGVTVVAGQAGTGDEGTAMLEIVHDLAPGAQLFFATALGSQAAFASNILTLRNTHGCDIIVDDVTYFAEAAFQDGTVAQAVNTVTAGGALFFSSAGNSGSKNKGTSGTWEGDFVEQPHHDSRDGRGGPQLQRSHRRLRGDQQPLLPGPGPSQPDLPEVVGPAGRLRQRLRPSTSSTRRSRTSSTPPPTHRTARRIPSRSSTPRPRASDS